MAELVTFSRYITLEWLSAVADYAIAGYTREEATIKLNELIGQSTSSAINIRKTRTILLHVWYDSNPKLKNKALELYHSVGSNEKLAIHWALLMDQYPIFLDLCDVIGHMFAFKDTISLAQIMTEIYAKWGERSTLVSSLQKNVRSLREIDALQTAGRAGVYQKQSHPISDPYAVWMLLYAILHSGKQDYITWSAFITHPALFPFVKNNVTEADMAAMRAIVMDRHNDQTIFRLDEKEK